MSVADWIRTRTDFELAEFFEMLLHERDLLLVQSLNKQGVEAILAEMPSISVAEHLKYLQSDFDGGEE